MAKTRDANQQKKLETLVQDLEEKYARARADYANLESRTIKERSEYLNLATAGFIQQLLPVLDDLERAASHLNDSGLNLVLDHFHQILAEADVTKIEVAQIDFDPLIMECTESVPGKKNAIISVIQPGYTLGDKLLRPAKVQVGNGQPESK